MAKMVKALPPKYRTADIGKLAGSKLSKSDIQAQTPQSGTDLKANAEMLLDKVRDGWANIKSNFSKLTAGVALARGQSVKYDEDTKMWTTTKKQATPEEWQKAALEFLGPNGANLKTSQTVLKPAVAGFAKLYTDKETGLMKDSSDDVKEHFGLDKDKSLMSGLISKTVEDAFGNKDKTAEKQTAKNIMQNSVKPSAQQGADYTKVFKDTEDEVSAESEFQYN